MMTMMTTNTTTNTTTTTTNFDSGLSADTLGAIVGGCVGVLILVGIIAFFVIRKRKSSASASASIPLNGVGADYDLGGGVRVPVIPPTASAIYGSVGLKQADYGDGPLDL
jgi:hypothetical protein